MSNYVFLTFMQKLSREEANSILFEIRKQMPGVKIIFAPRIPNGKKVLMKINGQTVILTYPYKNPQKNQGLTLGDMLETKIGKKE